MTARATAPYARPSRERAAVAASAADQIGLVDELVREATDPTRLVQ